MPEDFSLNLNHYNDKLCAAAYRTGLRDLDDLYTAVRSEPVHFIEILHPPYSYDVCSALREIICFHLESCSLDVDLLDDGERRVLARHFQELRDYCVQLQERPDEDKWTIVEALLAVAHRARRSEAVLKLGAEKITAQSGRPPPAVAPS